MSVNSISILQNFEMLTDALEHRLSSGDLTYIRHLGPAGRILFSTLDNLEGISSSLRGIGGTDQRATVNLPSKAGDAPGEQGRASIEARLAEVQRLYSQNEQAVATLDRAATALAEPRLKASLESAFDNLDRLAVYTEQPPTIEHH